MTQAPEYLHVILITKLIYIIPTCEICPIRHFFNPVEKHKSLLYFIVTTKKKELKLHWIMCLLIISLQNATESDKLAENPALKECLFYIKTYGSHLTVVQFYLRHGNLQSAVNFLLQQVLVLPQNLGIEQYLAWFFFFFFFGGGEGYS